MRKQSLRIIFAVILSIFLFIGPQELKAFDTHITDDNLFAARMEELLNVYNIPSVSACILKKDKNGIWDIAWEGAYGNSLAIWPRRKANIDTIYPVCSITKVFTATAVMQLKEQGLIHLDDDINNYMSFDIRNSGLNYNDPENPVPPITIRELLSHRSGLAGMPYSFFFNYKDTSTLDFGVFCNLAKLEEYLKKPDAWAHVCGNTPGVKRYYPPGEKFCYSNVGYLILGFLIEEVINKRNEGSRCINEDGKEIPCKTWKDFIQANILKPLGMNDTRFYWSDYPRWKTNKAQGYIEKRFESRINPDYPSDGDGKPPPGSVYDKKGNPVPKHILVPDRPPFRNSTIGILYNAGGAAGQIKGTISDLARFMVVHLNNGNGYLRDKEGNLVFGEDRKPVRIRILSKNSVESMHNFNDPRLCDVGNACGSLGTGDTTGLFKIAGYGMGWMRINWGGRYWNDLWNPDSTIHPKRRVDWAKLHPHGIVPEAVRQLNGVDMGGGLNVEGHGGDLPGYHSGMFRVSDNLAILYLMNESFSEEDRDESRIQPEKFKFYTSRSNGSPILKGGALPHNLVKFSEIEYLLLQKAASLK